MPSFSPVFTSDSRLVTTLTSLSPTIFCCNRMYTYARLALHHPSSIYPSTVHSPRRSQLPDQPKVILILLITILPFKHHIDCSSIFSLSPSFPCRIIFPSMFVVRASTCFQYHHPQTWRYQNSSSSLSRDDSLSILNMPTSIE